MSTFTAIILVCLSSISPESCDETNAVEIRSTRVASELGCVTGWQEIMARADAAGEIGRTTYVKTLCRRSPPASQKCVDRGQGRGCPSTRGRPALDQPPVPSEYHRTFRYPMESARFAAFQDIQQLTSQ